MPYDVLRLLQSSKRGTQTVYTRSYPINTLHPSFEDIYVDYNSIVVASSFLGSGHKRVYRFCVGGSQRYRSSSSSWFGTTVVVRKHYKQCAPAIVGSAPGTMLLLLLSSHKNITGI